MVRYRRNYVSGGTYFFTVTRVCDWPFSSFHSHVRRGVLPADWGGDVREIGGRFGER